MGTPKLNLANSDDRLFQRIVYPPTYIMAARLTGTYDLRAGVYKLF